VYWDWTLDWENLQEAPVFNSDQEIGFGTDGDKDGEITVGKTGRCVVDGAFKDIKLNFYDVKWKPHCLSRGFRDDNGVLGSIDGRPISPESIDEIMNLNEYEDFVKLMESRVHDTIPFGIGGDFETFTAPYGKSTLLLASKKTWTKCLNRSVVLSPPHAIRSTLVDMAEQGS
jgi:tyrosinase